jgi:glycine/D-amino acid oxidase-like deaminating enzyme
MRWLSAQLDAAGVTQQQRHVTSLAELAGEGWDVVINCCGLGSRDLLPDPHCYPIRGQILRVRAPWVNQCVFAEFPDETSYIIPNRYGAGQQRVWLQHPHHRSIQDDSVVCLPVKLSCNP